MVVVVLYMYSNETVTATLDHGAYDMIAALALHQFFGWHFKAWENSDGFRYRRATF
jgi:hypothetical protein